MVLLTRGHHDRHAEGERRLGECNRVADRLVRGDVLDQLDRADLVIDQQQGALVGLEMR
jgi:hypothetical protein